MNCLWIVASNHRAYVRPCKINRLTWVIEKLTAQRNKHAPVDLITGGVKGFSSIPFHIISCKSSPVQSNVIYNNKNWSRGEIKFTRFDSKTTTQEDASVGRGLLRGSDRVCLVFSDVQSRLPDVGVGEAQH